MPPESVAVVVVTHNSSDVLPGLVASLPAGLADVPFQLVVADNASSDGTAELVRELAPSATVIETGRNAGYAAGINTAVSAAAPCAAVLVLNPDVRLTPGCVPTLLSALRKPGVGIVVPRLVDARGDLILSMRREPTVLRAVADALLGAERAGRYPPLGEVVSDATRYDVEQATDWAEGSTQLVSAECWKRCGPWDESYFLYSEEADFDLRARDSGFRTLYVPTAEAVHLEGGSGASPGLWRLLVLNRVRLFQRRNGLARTVPFWAAVLLRETSRGILGKPTSREAAKALCSPARWRQVPGPEAIRH